MSALDLIVRESLDKDAAEYCRRSGAQDRQAINAFVRGVKALGLWDSMVCWPLRSTQNAGTGTTAYSLGGLGTFNGTLVGGPSWSADGLDFDGSDDRITTSFNPSFDNVCVYAAVNADNHDARRMIYAQRDNSSPLAGFNIYTESAAFGTIRTLRAEAYDTTWRLSDAGQVTDGTWASVGLYWDKSFITGHRDGQTGTPAAASFVSTQAARIGTNSGFWWDGKISMVAVVHNAANSYAALRNIYKQTLGTGLGLP